MRKSIRFLTVILVIIIFLFVTHINECYAIINEIDEVTNNNVNSNIISNEDEINENENQSTVEENGNVIEGDDNNTSEDFDNENKTENIMINNEIENNDIIDEDKTQNNVREEIEYNSIEPKKNEVGKTVEEGIYKIVLANAPTQSLTVDGGKTNDGANVHIWEYLNTMQQQFKLQYDGDGYYEIIPMHSGKRLDVVGYGNESNVDQWSNNGGNDNQKWAIIKSDAGNYNIISKRQNLYLDAYQSRTANGTNIQVYEKSGGKGQEFKLEKIDKEDIVGEKTVEEGIYKIVLASTPTQSLTVDGGRTNDGANVHIWEYQNVAQQQFELKYDDDGYYEIIPVHSQKRIDVVGYGNEANVDQWSYNGGNDNQKWIIRKSDAGNYNIISKRQNLYLDAYQSRSENGTNIQVYEKSGGKGQEFKLERLNMNPIVGEKTVEEGTYKILLANTPTQSLTVDGGKTNDGANVHIWEDLNTIQQQFNLIYDGDGYYEIIPVHSGKRLDVVGFGNESNVDQWSNNGGNDNQKWVIRKSDLGNYNIISKRLNLYLDAYQSRSENGTNIQVYEKSGGAGQEFKLEKIDNKSEITVANGVYKISPQSNNNMVVEASASNNENNGRIQIWENFNAFAQKFNIEYKDGFYKITMRHSGKSLTVKDNNFADGTDIVQYDYQGLDSQKWIIRDSGRNGLVISLFSNPDFSINIEGNIENGDKLILSNTKYNNNQLFLLNNITQSERLKDDRIYRLRVGTNTEKVVEASASNTDNNGKIQIWDNFNMEAQKLNFEYQDGFYKITLKHSGKSLTVKDNNLIDGTDIVQYDYQELDSQKWIVRDSGNNGVIISLLSNPELSITVEGNIENGDKLVLAKTEYNDNQIFNMQIAQITIVLNPGHGGSSTGCANGWMVEKNITLDIARKIQSNLSKYSDINVILTRTGDYDMDLPSRAMIARNNNADLYVSLHINDEGNHTATGSQMYVPFYEGTKHYNSNMTKLANLIQDKLGAIGIRENIPGGTTKRNVNTIPRYQYLMDGQVVQADYYADIRHAMKGDTLDYGPDLNTNTGVPAILVEHCFMNSSDSRFLDSDYDLQRIADADTAAIVEYFNL